MRNEDELEKEKKKKTWVNWNKKNVRDFNMALNTARKTIIRL